MLQRLRTFVLTSICAVSILPILSASPAIANPIDNSSCAQWVRLADVSAYQPDINWPQVARAGIAGVYIKATEGTWYTNPIFPLQKAGAASVGLPWGGYDYARPGDVNPVSDAQYFVAAGGASGTLPPVLDVEQSSASASFTTLWVAYWSAEVKALTGRSPTTIYTGAFYPWSNDPTLSNVGPLWVSAYPYGYNAVPNQSACGLQQPATAAWSGWNIWQYTSVGNVYGIPGNVDLDAATPAWWAAATGGTVTPPTPGGNNYPGATYTIGSSGTAVIQIQTLLRNAGLYVGALDGVYGQGTANAVAGWQARLGLAADGIWGPATHNATNNFFSWIAAIQKQDKPKPTPPPLTPTQIAVLKMIHACTRTSLRIGSNGVCVTFAQQRLQARGWPVAADGVFGKTTALAVVNAKTARHWPNKLPVLGRHFWKVLI